ncbi:transcriptional regulator [Klebsiella phage vB_KpnP_ZX1]|nr:transcriptional regulator [Klebsiella phage vB_KpnP_ZX1]
MPKLPSVFPIVHDHGTDAKSAERHCLSLVKGGWSAKLVRPAGRGWRVVISGYRG